MHYDSVEDQTWEPRKNLENVKYLQSLGCKLNITYEICDQFLDDECDREPIFLQYVTKKTSGFNIDNRYIIKSIINNNYDFFEALYENYPEIKDHIFVDEKLNEKLKEFVTKYNNKIKN